VFQRLALPTPDKLMAVDVRTDTDRFEQSTPHALFEAPLEILCGIPAT